MADAKQTHERGPKRDALHVAFVLDESGSRRPLAANPCANDAALRQTVHERLTVHSPPGVNEVCVRGRRHRLDIAGMLDGTLCGFEIKADNDDLSRLRAQARAARPRFRRLVLVVGPRHFKKAVEQVPRWWGVWLASPDLDSPTGVVLTVEREALDNPRFNRLAQAKILQKAELRALPTRCAIDLRGTNDTRNALAQAAADQLSVEVVEAEILHALQVRRCDAAVPKQQEQMPPRRLISTGMRALA